MSNQAGTPITGTFSSSGTTRTFTPTADWAPGINKVNVVQQRYATPVLATATVKEGIWVATLNTALPDLPAGPYELSAQQIVEGVPSDWLNPSFVIKVKPPKPTITAPPNPSHPEQSLAITNIFSDLATATLMDALSSPIPGTFTGSGTTRTFAPDQDWAPGDNTVKVVQTVRGVDSDPSDECTFTVEELEKPEAPQFELPLASSKTSTRPIIRVTGLPRAVMTVRLEGAETLHSDAADGDGVLEFAVTTPLTPGAISLEVKQKAEGPESEWSEPHRFTVKELPKTPVIEAPRNGSSNIRKLTIKGTGETRGQILLRHEDDPENLIDTIAGETPWRWTAKELWDVGTYTIQVQQTEDGDSSSWTEPRTFEVVDARYGIGEAGPVLSQPVVGTGQSVLLRVQVITGDKGETAEGVKVEWRIKGGQDVIATTETGPDGWARLLYTPDTPGTFEVLADITRDNQGVVMTQPFEVTALQQDAWAQEAEFYLNDERVDLTKGDLFLFKGKAHELELRVKSSSVLIGSSVTLQEQSGVMESGLRFAPDLGTPQTVEQGKNLRWSISFDGGKDGFFGLKLTSSKLPDWHFAGASGVGRPG